MNANLLQIPIILVVTDADYYPLPGDPKVFDLEAATTAHCEQWAREAA